MEKYGDSDEMAQVLALHALEFVLQSDQLIQIFIANTGVYPSDLPRLAQTPLFLGAVLDFLMEDDQRVIDFCKAQSYPLTALQSARVRLPGGQHQHWT